TRFGSTLCRSAACSIALSISPGFAVVPRKLAAMILAVADWLASRPRNSLTSAAADRAARMLAALADGTGFQRFSFELQYISFRRGESVVSTRRVPFAGTDSLT